MRLFILSIVTVLFLVVPSISNGSVEKLDVPIVESSGVEIPVVMQHQCNILWPFRCYRMIPRVVVKKEVVVVERPVLRIRKVVVKTTKTMVRRSTRQLFYRIHRFRRCYCEVCNDKS